VVFGATCQARIMSALMHLVTLNGSSVLAPLVLDMDERPLPLAEREVLYARERKQVVFSVSIPRIHHSRSISLTPAGMRLRSIATQ
jgi:hypothetical protein